VGPNLPPRDIKYDADAKSLDAKRDAILAGSLLGCCLGCFGDAIVKKGFPHVEINPFFYRVGLMPSSAMLKALSQRACGSP
jgi:hypothetical protein